MPLTSQMIPSSAVVTTSSIVTPSLVLAAPTAITGVDANGLATADYDDYAFPLTLPFELEIYGVNTSTISICVNGLIGSGSFTYCDYVNEQLPSTSTDWAFLPYWLDLFIYEGTPQGLYYEVSGTAPERTLTFEWYTATFENSDTYYHFTASFDEAAPSLVRYAYYDLSYVLPETDTALGTVGLQMSSQNEYAQYSYGDSPHISAGQVLTYDSVSNAFISSS